MEHLNAGKAVVSRLSQAGHVAYFAGGWVRDYLLKHPSDDIDIATSASVTEVQALFPHTIPVGIAFGIIIVVEGSHHFEVATFRKEKGYHDGRRPTSIEPASAQEDAERRDFTINGMFWDPLHEKLYDFVGGQKDLREEIIRAIGDPHERFLEDRLRMMRAVRYSTRFNFPIEEATAQAIISHAPSLLPAVAMERVWQEFRKMSTFAHFDRGLLSLHQLHLLPVIFPRLKSIPLTEIKHRLAPLSFFPPKTPAIAEMIELFPDATLEERLELCEYLKLSSDEREIVRFLYKLEQLFAFPQQWRLEDHEWAKIYAHPYGPLGVTIRAAHLPPSDQETFLSYHRKQQEELSSFIVRLQKKTPLVRAEHLMQHGIAPSPHMGRLLVEAERISINDRLSTPESVIVMLKKSPLWDH